MPTLEYTQTSNAPRITNSSDILFAKGIRSRNKEVTELFYEKYAAALYGMIKKELLSDDVCAMVLEDTFKKIISSIYSYNAERETLFVWSYKIARKEVSRQKVNLVLRQLFSC